MFKLEIDVAQPHPDYPDDDARNQLQKIDLDLTESKFVFIHARLLLDGEVVDEVDLDYQ